jgi:hypothetical protein
MDLQFRQLFIVKAGNAKELPLSLQEQEEATQGMFI